MEQALKKAGAAQPPGPGLGPFPKCTDAKEKRAVDYGQEAFPPPTLCVVQPGGGHLKAAPPQHRPERAAEMHATRGEVIVHIQALAQGGRQHAEYRDHSHWLRDWDDCLQQLCSSQEALKHLQEEETHMDEVHAGAILATIHALQNRWDELRKEVVEMKQHRTSGHKQLREARKETKDQTVCADAAEADLQRVRDALHQAEEERDEAQAAHQKALIKSTQTLADQGIQLLRQELDAAQKELEHLRSWGGVSTPAANAAKLQSQLQEAQAALAAQQAVSPDAALQQWIATPEQECQQARGRSKDCWIKARLCRTSMWTCRTKRPRRKLSSWKGNSG